MYVIWYMISCGPFELSFDDAAGATFILMFRSLHHYSYPPVVNIVIKLSCNP